VVIRLIFGSIIVDHIANYSITLTLGLSISYTVKSPQELVYMSSRTLPGFTGQTVFTSYPTDKQAFHNQTNDILWLAAKANCPTVNGVPTCKDSVEAEISLWTTYSTDGTAHWPPYTLIDQRRTAKFNIPQWTWVYFWLTVTNDNLDTNGGFNLYMGVQFYADGSSSAVQMSIYAPQDNWPTGNNTNTTASTALDYYPKDPFQKNDWIQPSPTPLKTGLYKIGAQNTINQAAQFTIKCGFNKPPVQSANLNASFSPIGLLTLILLCIMVHMKHAFF